MFNVNRGPRLLTFGLLAAVSVAAHADPNLKKSSPVQSAKNSDVRRRMIEREAQFFENKGQWDQRGQFLGRQPGLDVWFENRGVDFDYYRVSGTIRKPTRQGQRVSMQFVGHGGSLKYSGVNATKSVNDYLLGKLDVRHVKGYHEVASRSIFPGVDFRGYFEKGNPRYDFIVSPGANPANIKLAFVGADKLKLSDKGVVLSTHVGERIQGDLHAYQLVHGVRKHVDAKFTLLAKNQVGVSVGSYDRTQPLVVDPLVYGTYFGGDSGFDTVRDVVADSSLSGAAYLTGDTQSTLFPAIYGPYGLNIKGEQNAFIAKLQGDAYNIDYAAYIGGSGIDSGQFLRLDSDGNLWMAGTSSSSDFPGNTRNAQFILENVGDGTGTFNLIFHGFEYGSLSGSATAAQVDSLLNTTKGGPLFGKVVSVTELDGTNLGIGGRYEITLSAPGSSATAGELSVDPFSDSADVVTLDVPYVFVLPFHASASTVLSPLPTQEFSFGDDIGTELNGYDVHEVPNATGATPVDMVFAGTTDRAISSLAGVTYPGNDDVEKGYMLRLTFTASKGYSVNTPFSKYISGAFPVNNRGVVLDSSGAAYTVGTVFGDANYDTSINPVFTTTNSIFFGGRLLKQADLYVQKYSGANGALTWSGLVGGHSFDVAGGFIQDFDLSDVPTGSAIAVDPSDNVYITGVSNSFDYPRTRGVYGEDFTDLQNVAVTKISADGSTILYSTNLNATNNNVPAGIAVDERGDVFVTGNGVPGEIFPEDLGNTPGNPDQPTTTVYATIGVTSDGLPQPAFPTAPALGVYSAWVNVLDADATGLLYGSYLGGVLDTRAYGPYVDAFGDCWLFGWVESFRGYAVFPTPTGSPTVYLENALLPPSMLSSNAFKSYPDNGGSTEIVSAYGFLDIFGNGPFLAAPAAVEASSLRDGWVNKIRVGLASVQGLSLSPATIPGGFGSSSTGTVTLSAAAPSGGATVTISILSGTGASFSPTTNVTSTTINIPQGSTVGTFTVYGNIVLANQVVTIQANYLGSFENAALNVIPYLNKFTVTPSSIVGGNSVVGTIQLVQVAPSGGIPVVLTGSPSGLVTFTDNNGNSVHSVTVTVPAGTDTLTVPIGTAGVSTATALNVSASIGGYSLTQTVTLVPATLTSLTFTPQTVAAGNSVTGTLSLNGLAGQNLLVKLTVTSGTNVSNFIPAYEVIPAQTGSVTFNLTAPFATKLTDTIGVTAVIVPAKGTQYQTNSVFATLIIDNFDVIALAVSPNQIGYSQTATGTVSVGSAAPSGGILIHLSSSNPSYLQVPSTVTIAEGQSTATFTVTGENPAQAVSATITAQRENSGAVVSKSATVQVGAVPFSLQLNPGEVPGGSATQGIVSIPYAANADLTLYLSEGPTGKGISLPSPATVTIPAGSTEATFNIGTSPASATINATIAAKYISTHGSAVLTEVVGSALIVDPISVASIAFSPVQVVGGSQTKVTITLTGAALGSGALVSLSSTTPAYINLPSSVTIPAGQTSYSFYLGTNRVSRTVSTTITASYNGGIAPGTLTILH